MTDGMFCAQYLSQYQEILSKMRLFGTRNCSKLGRSLYLLIFLFIYISFLLLFFLFIVILHVFFCEIIQSHLFAVLRVSPFSPSCFFFFFFFFFFLKGGGGAGGRPDGPI